MIQKLKSVIFGRRRKIFALYANKDGMFLDCLEVDMSAYLKDKNVEVRRGIRWNIQTKPQTFIDALESISSGKEYGAFWTENEETISGTMSEGVIEEQRNYFCSFTVAKQ